MLSLLMFTLVSLVVATQSSTTSADSQAEQQARQACDEEIQAFLHKTQKPWRGLWVPQP